MPTDAIARMYNVETEKSVSCKGVSTPKMLTTGPIGITANTSIAAAAAMIGANR